ncbi:MAG: hypothetical protein J6Y90_00925, partial [Lachnospiraceae bacterium]|nr:hypothetical protein [Lachnospiraceae bacterium]
MKENSRRIIAFLCALCLVLSGEARFSLIALADVLHSIPAVYAVDNTKSAVYDVEDAADVTDAADVAIAEAVTDVADVSVAATAEAVSDVAAVATAKTDIAEELADDAGITDVSAAGHADEAKSAVNQAVAAAGTEVETVLTESVLTAEWDIYRIKVRYGKDSGIPEDAQLVVREITEKNDPNYADYISSGADTAGVQAGTVGIAKAFDISLRSNETGEEYQPSGDMKVEISIPSYYIDDTMQVDVVHFAEKQADAISDDLRENGTDKGTDKSSDGKASGLDGAITEVLDSVPVLMDVNLVNNTAAFTTDGFSVFVVLGYTVDFHWGEYTYTMEGGSTILLSEMLETVVANSKEGSPYGLSEDDISKLKDILKDPTIIDTVKFSDPELMDIEKVDTKKAREILKARTEEDRLAIEREVESGEV